MDKFENLISKAEIAYKGGKTLQALSYARKALEKCDVHSQKIALRIFIARCFSKLKKYDESNKIYRNLLKEKVYIAPVIMGLFYNNFERAGAEKMQLNLGLVKLCLLLP